MRSTSPSAKKRRVVQTPPAASLQSDPLADRLQSLNSTSGVAFPFGAGCWTLSTALRRRCTVCEGRWLPAMVPCKGARNGRRGWGPAAAHVARTRARNLGSLWERSYLAVQATSRGPEPTARPSIATRGSRPCLGARGGHVAAHQRKLATRSRGDPTGRPKPKAAKPGGSAAKRL